MIALLAFPALAALCWLLARGCVAVIMRMGRV